MKTLFNILEKTAAITLMFWVFETLFFIIRDGWHLKAVTPDEKGL